MKQSTDHGRGVVRIPEGNHIDAIDPDREGMLNIARYKNRTVFSLFPLTDPSLKTENEDLTIFNLQC